MATITEKMESASIQAAKVELERIVASDGLKPQYNGMSAWEIAKIMLREAKKAGLAVMGEDMAKEEKDKELPVGCQCKCGNDLKCMHKDTEEHEGGICGSCAG